jgi:phosphate starvation-inducible protein PhoH
VITGDITQIDLPRRVDSGLVHALSILKGVEGIHFAWLHTADVVRHPLIKKIIQAYDASALAVASATANAGPEQARTGETHEKT